MHVVTTYASLLKYRLGIVDLDQTVAGGVNMIYPINGIDIYF